MGHPSILQKKAAPRPPPAVPRPPQAVPRPPPAAPRPPPAAPAPDPEELRQALSKRIDEVDQLYEQWINTLKAVQEAQTDRWEKRWAGDAVTMALMARRQDIPKAPDAA